MFHYELKEFIAFIKGLPCWVFAILMFGLLVAIASNVYVYQKCGISGFFFGSGAMYAATHGLCDG